jgi:hypothetical protein
MIVKLLNFFIVQATSKGGTKMPCVWRGPIGTCFSKRHYTSIIVEQAGNAKGGSITVPLTSCLTGLQLAI